MKREIKFRGRNYYGMWMYGYLMPAPKPTIHIDCDYSISVSPSALKSVDRMLYEVETNTIGQFTGLKDINGKEIYEGDIIKGLDSTKNDILHVVKWDNQTASFEAYLIPFDKHLHKGPLSQNWLDFFDKEVIGNIHDNPELLEGGVNKSEFDPNRSFEEKREILCKTQIDEEMSYKERLRLQKLRHGL